MPKQWFRMHCSVVDNPKIARLPDKIYRFWTNILMISTRTSGDGTLPSVADLAFACRIPEAQVTAFLQHLIDVKLIDRGANSLKLHDWEEWQYTSDVSTKRVQRHRMKRSGNVSPTVSRNVSETDQSRAEQSRADTSGVSVDLEPIFERCYQASVKRQNRGIAERYFVDAAAKLDPAIIEARWLKQNAAWSQDKFAKGVQTFADWLLDRNYEFDPDATNARNEAELPLWVIEAREVGL